MKPYYEESGIVIYNADCREVLPTLPPVDLVLTDPPYGIAYDSRGGVQLAARRVYDVPTVAGDSEPFDPRHLLTVGTRQMIWGADHFRSLLPEYGRLLVWYKRHPKSDPDALKFADAEIAWDSEGSLVRVIRHIEEGFIRDSNEPRVHPTQKPTAVMAWCLSLAADSRNVLDPYMGSGTTLVAAKQLGRRCTGIEIEERYCEIAAERLRQSVLDFGPVVPKPEQADMFGGAA